MHGGSLASDNVVNSVVQGAYKVLDSYFTDAAPQRGGSLASDAVVALVQPEAWCRMNTWFTNRIVMMGGGVKRKTPCKTPGKTPCKTLKTPGNCSMHGGEGDAVPVTVPVSAPAAGECTIGSAVSAALGMSPDGTPTPFSPPHTMPVSGSSLAVANASLPDMSYVPYKPFIIVPNVFPDTPFVL